MRKKYRYFEADWTKVEQFVDPSKRTAIRGELEAAANRYLLSRYDQDSTRPEELKWTIAKRRCIALLAQPLLNELERTDINPIELGLGRLLGLHLPGVVERAAKEEFESICRSLRMLIAWSNSDELSFFPKKARAHKPAKTWLVATCLGIWRKLGHHVPSGGGTVSGRMSKFVRACCNPILREMKDGISDGEAAKKAIKTAVRSHRELIFPSGEN
jgi:hypothetical protein